MGKDLSAKKLAELVTRYNETHPPELHVTKRGNSSVDLPNGLMCSFYQPLFENIKSKVE